jgi:hypothetical protein
MSKNKALKETIAAETGALIKIAQLEQRKKKLLAQEAEAKTELKAVLKRKFDLVHASTGTVDDRDDSDDDDDDADDNSGGGANEDDDNGGGGGGDDELKIDAEDDDDEEEDPARALQKNGFFVVDEEQGLSQEQKFAFAALHNAAVAYGGFSRSDNPVSFINKCFGFVWKGKVQNEIAKSVAPGACLEWLKAILKVKPRAVPKKLMEAVAWKVKHEEAEEEEEEESDEENGGEDDLTEEEKAEKEKEDQDQYGGGDGADDEGRDGGGDGGGGRPQRASAIEAQKIAVKVAKAEQAATPPAKKAKKQEQEQEQEEEEEAYHHEQKKNSTPKKSPATPPKKSPAAIQRNAFHPAANLKKAAAPTPKYPQPKGWEKVCKLPDSRLDANGTKATVPFAKIDIVNAALKAEEWRTVNMATRQFKANGAYTLTVLQPPQ